MVDMSQTIAPKSDQLNADDLIAGPKTIKITRVEGTDSNEQPVSVYFEGDNGKPYKPGLSMRRVMVTVWGTDSADYIGRSMTLYNDPEIMFGGIKVGGIRISHMSHMDGRTSMMLTTTRSRRKEFTVSPLADNPSEEALIRGMEAADQGVEEFRKFWNSAYGKKHREELRAHIETLQERATRATEDKLPLSQRLAQAKAEAEAGETTQTDEGGADEVPDGAVDPSEFEYAEGRTAASDGKPLADNPYPNDPYKMRHWIAGWQSKGEGE